jgi:hypothetical protein
MKSKLIIAVVIGVIIIMGLFDFMKRKKVVEPIHRLVWFELQIAPASYRFAIMPEQPILIGYEGENGEKGATMLIRYEHVPDVFERTVERVDALVRRSGIMGLPPSDPNRAFDDEAMVDQSVHVRVAYADNTRWASVYGADEIPHAVAGLIHESKALAKQIMQEQTSEAINGDTAQAFLEPEKNQAQKNAPSVIVKVKVLLSGEVTANGEKVTLQELGNILDDLKKEGGGVWYFRESPEQEPPASLVSTIEAVMDTIASRRLPVRLQPEEY